MISTDETTRCPAGLETRKAPFPAPKAPQTLAETGLSESQVTDLILKVLFQRGAQEGNQLGGGHLPSLSWSWTNFSFS